jgi:hypothetical protein
MTLFLFVGFEVFMAVTMKNAVFWDVALCRFVINRRFGGMCHLNLQDRRNMPFLAHVISSTL